MQISAISAQGFTSKPKNIENIVTQDDLVLKQAAVEAALLTSNEKKHKQLNNALWYSMPLVAGVSGAILHKGKSALFGQHIFGTAAKLASGLKHAAGWGIAIAAADAVVGTKNILSKNSDTVRDFERKNPFLSFAGLVVAGVAALSYLPKGIGKLYSKLSPKLVGKLAAKTGKVADKINGSKFVKSMNANLNKLGKKVPSVVKETGKTVLNYAPEALLIGTVVNSVGHGLSVNSKVNQNYNYFRDVQLDQARAQINELQVENDFLKTSPENLEHLKLRKEPLADLPEDVLEKVEALHNEENAE